MAGPEFTRKRTPPAAPPAHNKPGGGPHGARVPPPTKTTNVRFPTGKSKPPAKPPGAFGSLPLTLVPMTPAGSAPGVSNSPFAGISHTNAPAHNLHTPHLTAKVQLARLNRARLENGGLLTSEQLHQERVAKTVLATPVHKLRQVTPPPELERTGGPTGPPIPPPPVSMLPLAKPPTAIGAPAGPQAPPRFLSQPMAPHYAPPPSTETFVAKPQTEYDWLTSFFHAPGDKPRRVSPREQMQAEQPGQGSVNIGSSLGRLGDTLAKSAHQAKNSYPKPIRTGLAATRDLASKSAGGAIEALASIPGTTYTPMHPAEQAKTPVEEKAKPTYLVPAERDVTKRWNQAAYDASKKISTAGEHATALPTAFLDKHGGGNGGVAFAKTFPGQTVITEDMMKELAYEQGGSLGPMSPELRHTMIEGSVKIGWPRQDVIRMDDLELYHAFGNPPANPIIQWVKNFGSGAAVNAAAPAGVVATGDAAVRAATGDADPLKAIGQSVIEGTTKTLPKYGDRPITQNLYWHPFETLQNLLVTLGAVDSAAGMLSKAEMTPRLIHPEGLDTPLQRGNLDVRPLRRTIAQARDKYVDSRIPYVNDIPVVGPKARRTHAMRQALVDTEERSAGVERIRAAELAVPLIHAAQKIGPQRVAELNSLLQGSDPAQRAAFYQATADALGPVAGRGAKAHAKLSKNMVEKGRLTLSEDDKAYMDAVRAAMTHATETRAGQGQFSMEKAARYRIYQEPLQIDARHGHPLAQQVLADRKVWLDVAGKREPPVEPNVNSTPVEVKLGEVNRAIKRHERALAKSGYRGKPTTVKDAQGKAIPTEPLEVDRRANTNVGDELPPRPLAADAMKAHREAVKAHRAKGPGPFKPPPPLKRTEQEGEQQLTKEPDEPMRRFNENLDRLEAAQKKKAGKVTFGSADDEHWAHRNAAHEIAKHPELQAKIDSNPQLKARWDAAEQAHLKPIADAIEEGYKKARAAKGGSDPVVLLRHVLDAINEGRGKYQKITRATFAEMLYKIDEAGHLFPRFRLHGSSSARNSVTFQVHGHTGEGGYQKRSGSRMHQTYGAISIQSHAERRANELAGEDAMAAMEDNPEPPMTPEEEKRALRHAAEFNKQNAPKPAKPAAKQEHEVGHTSVSHATYMNRANAKRAGDAAARNRPGYTSEVVSDGTLFRYKLTRTQLGEPRWLLQGNAQHGGQGWSVRSTHGNVEKNFPDEKTARTWMSKHTPPGRTPEPSKPKGQPQGMPTPPPKGTAARLRDMATRERELDASGEARSEGDPNLEVRYVGPRLDAQGKEIPNAEGHFDWGSSYAVYDKSGKEVFRGGEQDALEFKGDTRMTERAGVNRLREERDAARAKDKRRLKPDELTPTVVHPVGGHVFGGVSRSLGIFPSEAEARAAGAKWVHEYEPSGPYEIEPHYDVYPRGSGKSKRFEVITRTRDHGEPGAREAEQAATLAEAEKRFGPFRPENDGRTPEYDAMRERQSAERAAKLMGKYEVSYDAKTKRWFAHDKNNTWRSEPHRYRDDAEREARSRRYDEDQAAAGIGQDNGPQVGDPVAEEGGRRGKITRVNPDGSIMVLYDGEKRAVRHAAEDQQGVAATEADVPATHQRGVKTRLEQQLGENPTKAQLAAVKKDRARSDADKGKYQVGDQVMMRNSAGVVAGKVKSIDEHGDVTVDFGKMGTHPVPPGDLDFNTVAFPDAAAKAAKRRLTDAALAERKAAPSGEPTAVRDGYRRGPKKWRGTHADGEDAGWFGTKKEALAAASGESRRAKTDRVTANVPPPRAVSGEQLDATLARVERLTTGRKSQPTETNTPKGTKAERDVTREEARAAHEKAVEEHMAKGPSREDAVAAHHQSVAAWREKKKQIDAKARRKADAARVHETQLRQLRKRRDNLSVRADQQFQEKGPDANALKAAAGEAYSSGLDKYIAEHDARGGVKPVFIPQEVPQDVASRFRDRRSSLQPVAARPSITATEDKLINSGGYRSTAQGIAREVYNAAMVKARVEYFHAVRNEYGTQAEPGIEADPDKVYVKARALNTPVDLMHTVGEHNLTDETVASTLAKLHEQLTTGKLEPRRHGGFVPDDGETYYSLPKTIYEELTKSTDASNYGTTGYDNFNRMYQRAMLSKPSTGVSNVGGNPILAMMGGASPWEATMGGYQMARHPEWLPPRLSEGGLAMALGQRPASTPIGRVVNWSLSRQRASELAARAGLYHHFAGPHVKAEMEATNVTADTVLRRMAEGKDPMGAHLARQVEHFLPGNRRSGKFSPEAEKWMGRSILFHHWLGHILTLTLYTLPVKYPARALLLQRISEVGNDYRKHHGVFPSWYIGMLPLMQFIAGNGDHKTWAIPTSSIWPNANLPLPLAEEQGANPYAAVINSAQPVIRTAIEAPMGYDLANMRAFRDAKGKAIGPGVNADLMLGQQWRNTPWVSMFAPFSGRGDTAYPTSWTPRAQLNQNGFPLPKGYGTSAEPFGGGTPSLTPQYLFGLGTRGIFGGSGLQALQSQTKGTEYVRATSTSPNALKGNIAARKAIAKAQAKSRAKRAKEKAKHG